LVSFILRASDGREYSVPHPRFILFGQFEVAEVNRDRDIDRLNPLHLVSLQRLTDRNGPDAKTAAG